VGKVELLTKVVSIMCLN